MVKKYKIIEIKLHRKSKEKNERGKPIHELIHNVKFTERGKEEVRYLKDRQGKNTKVEQTVWRNGKKIHIHNKTSGKIEIWLKEGENYQDKSGKVYRKTNEDTNKIFFEDDKGKIYCHNIN